jgi:isoleucyl-tRNA synthetase
MEYLSEDDNMLVKRIKPDFKRLGPRFGKQMKQIARKVSELEQSDIRKLESDGELTLDIGSERINLEREDFEISTQDIPGWLVASDGYLTVALDITVTDDLRDEGIAREMVNRIQNLRKDSGFDVTDKIALKVLEHDNLNRAVQNNLEYICAETLAGSLDLVPDLNMDNAVPVEVEDGITTRVLIEKMD